MTDEFQIHIPPSFMALYVPPGKTKPTLGQRDMAERYELCEDLANLLTEKAANMQFTLGITCLLYTSPSPRDVEESRMPSSA